MIRRLHFWALAAVLLLAPLPFGANRPVFWSLLALSVGLLALTWPVASRDMAERLSPLPRRIAVPALLFAAVILWAGLQTSGLLPTGLTHPVWSDARTALPEAFAPTARVAVAPEAAWNAIMLLICNAAIFWLAFTHARSTQSAHRLIDILALGCGLYALYGLGAYFSGTETILWMPKWAYPDQVTSTFVNPNHFATFAGLGALSAATALARRCAVPHFISVTKAWLYIGALLLCLVALAATASRGGIAASAIGFVVFCVGLLVFRRPPAKRPAVLLAATAVLVAIAGLAVIVILDRGMSFHGGEDRMRVYRITLDLILARPFQGYGLGAFPGVFAAVRPETVTQVWTEAHNGYLELALDLGIPAAACFLLALLGLAGRCVRGLLTRRRDGYLPVLGLASSLLVGSHALLDFSIQIPAVAAIWAAIMGIAVAQSWSSADDPQVTVMAAPAAA